MPLHLFEWTRHLAAGLPSSCALCGTAGKDNLCVPCHTRYFSRHPRRCAQCGLPLDDATDAALRCGECLQATRSFDATVVAADYAPPVDHLVLALKFGGQLALAPLLGRMLRDAMLRQRSAALPSLLTVVPLGEQRLAERGFNQALEIAKSLAQAVAAPLAPQLLERTRDTQMQSMLPPGERHKNVRHAFVVAAGGADLVRGQHVGVVDDVMTTGETLNDIAATLKRHGAARVTNLVFARTPPK
ncbi:MAG TPA: phosphoribosyltransferase family protein [Oxalicibacterium sp.]|nr:phosphoribosyltransferase family protein [Oxalicibacterium sp.]